MKYVHYFETEVNMNSVMFSDNYTEPWLSAARDGNGKINYNIGTNGYEFVDLGLPSGTLWAKYDIGVNQVYAYWGYTYQWGHINRNTETYSPTTWTGYRFGSSADNLTKYNASDGKTVLDLADDIAHVSMGGNWRMPTKEDCLELYQNCNVSFVKLDPNQTTYQQTKLTSKINGNYIIFPQIVFSIWTSSVREYSTYQYAYKFWQYSESNNYYMGVGSSFRYEAKQVRGVIKL